MNLCKHLQNWFGNKKSAPSTRRVSLAIECLESRLVPTGIALLSDKTLLLDGFGASTAVGASAWQTPDGKTWAAIRIGTVYDLKSYAPGAVKQVIIAGGPMSDMLSNTTSLPSRIDGHGGDDILTGGSAKDQLFGGDGKDTLRGNGDDDFLYGGLKVDTLFGDAGNDTLFGDDGDDFLYGGINSDILRGGAGIDSLYGEDGDDFLYGQADADTLDGGSGNDLLFGGIMDYHGTSHSSDLLKGGPGADRLLKDTTDRISGTSDPLDAEILFKNNTDTAVLSASGVPKVMNYGKATWTDGEVEKVDGGLAWLQSLTTSTALLHTAAGGDLSFQKVGRYLPYNAADGADDINDAAANKFGPTVGGWNRQSGTIVLTMGGLGGSDAGIREMVVHEIGHNWDGYSASRIAGYDFWDRWLKLSGWQQTQNATNTLVLSGDGQWFHSATAVFAREQLNSLDMYSRWNPNEDWSTSWELYYRNTQGTLSPAIATNMAAKFALIDELLAALRARPVSR